MSSTGKGPISGRRVNLRRRWRQTGRRKREDGWRVLVERPKRDIWKMLEAYFCWTGDVYWCGEAEGLMYACGLGCSCLAGNIMPSTMPFGERERDKCVARLPRFLSDGSNEIDDSFRESLSQPTYPSTALIFLCAQDTVHFIIVMLKCRKRPHQQFLLSLYTFNNHSQEKHNLKPYQRLPNSLIPLPHSPPASQLVENRSTAPYHTS